MPPAKPGIQNNLLSSLGIKRNAKSPAIATPIRFAKRIANG
jgi:hypothetical protein